MCMQPNVQKGIPLNPETLAEMKTKERAFWEGFLRDAEVALVNAERKGREPPYIPPDSLKGKFLTAIKQYKGGQYCQVQHLRRIFSFN